MRSVSSAICTSGEPVSPSCVRNCSMRLFFLSTASGMSRLQSPRPGEPSLPRQGGFQNPLFCQQIRMETTTRAWLSKANGAGGAARRGHVGPDLLPEGVDARELPLVPEPVNERQDHVLVVKIANEIQKMSFDRELVFAK